MNREERERCGKVLRIDKKEFKAWLKTLEFKKDEWWKVVDGDCWRIGDVVDRKRVKVFSVQGYESYATISGSKLAPIGRWKKTTDPRIAAPPPDLVSQGIRALRAEQLYRYREMATIRAQEFSVSANQYQTLMGRLRAQTTNR